MGQRDLPENTARNKPLEGMNDLHIELAAYFAEIHRPPVDESVVQWAERCVALTLKQTEQPGPFSVSNRPYMREPLEAWKENKVSELTLCWGTQTAKTTVIMVGSCWMICNDPGPMVWGMPSEQLARSFVKSRWRPMIDDCTDSQSQAKKGKTEILEQHFEQMTLNFVGAGSPTNIASRPARIVLADEVDKFPPATAREADTLDLLLERCKSFSSSKAVMTSTPTIFEGRIWTKFLEGDQRHFYIPCPHCGVFIKLLWPQVKWDQSAKVKEREWNLSHVMKSAYYECQECKGQITDSQKIIALRKGEWRAENPNAMPGVRSYHLSSLYSPYRKCTWGQLATSYLKALVSLAGLQNFINSTLAEPWMNQDSLEDKRINFSVTTPDAPALKRSVKFLTVDCQRLSPLFWFIIREWGSSTEKGSTGDSRLVDFGPLESWDEVRAKQLEHGVENMHVCIDSGDDPSRFVYPFCLNPEHGTFDTRNIAGIGLQKIWHGWLPAKGMSERTWQGSKTRSPKTWHIGRAELPHNDFILPLLQFSGPHIKDYLDRLRRGKTKYVWEISSKVNETYLEHITAERRRDIKDRFTGEVKGTEWYCPRSKENHLNDCEVMQVVMALFFGKLTIE